MSAIMKGVFGLAIVLACGFAQAQQCVNDTREATSVMRAIGSDAAQTLFPNERSRGGKWVRCSIDGRPMANGPCACIKSEGRDAQSVATKYYTTVYSGTTGNSIRITKQSSGGAILASKVYTEGQTVPNVIRGSDPCAGLWGEALTKCKAAQETTGGDVGQAIGTIIRVIPGLFGR